MTADMGLRRSGVMHSPRGELARAVWKAVVTSTSRVAIFRREQPGSRRAFASANVLRKVRAPWARRQVTPGHGDFAVTDSATENRPPRNIVVRVKRWGKSPPRFPATEAARQTPPEQGQIGGEEKPTPTNTPRVGCTRAEVTPLPEE